jgi:hypothetical protein
MTRARLHAAILAALAVAGLLAPAWLAVARQAPDDRARIKAPPAGKATGLSAVDIGGNWILRKPRPWPRPVRRCVRATRRPARPGSVPCCCRAWCGSMWRRS